MRACFQRACIFKHKPLAFTNTIKSKNKPLLNQIHKLISRNTKVLTEKKTNTQHTLRKAEARANPLLSKDLCPAIVFVPIEPFSLPELKYVLR